jgi:diketogulonate reductase-like aldo/keto reductase
MEFRNLPSGTTVPALGLGTWHMGESRERRGAEVAALRQALELGYRLIDTAEMYGEGGAEEVVGQAVGEALRAGDLRREELFVVSKVYPHNASRRGTPQACERSLRRLGLERIDLYLLHWRGGHPLAETVEALRALRAQGRIAHWGVSNFDVEDLQELAAIAPEVAGPEACATNQVYYAASERGPEFALRPWMHERGMPTMAYSPLDQGALAKDATLAAIGSPRGLSAAQVALAWVLGQQGTIAIPKAADTRHLHDNWAAAGVELDAEALRRIDAAFPPPRRRTPLAMI